MILMLTSVTYQGARYVNGEVYSLPAAREFELMNAGYATSTLTHSTAIEEALADAVARALVLPSTTRDAAYALAAARGGLAYFPDPTRYASQIATGTLTIPLYRNVFTDPSTGLNITRVSDRTTFGTTSVSPTNNRFPRHNYSKNQPWNSDGTLLYLNYPTPLLLLDGNDFTYKGAVSQPSESMWANSITTPKRIYGHDGAKLVRMDAVDTAPVITTVHDWTGTYDAIWLGYNEGNASADDRYFPIIGLVGSAQYVFVYDQVTDTSGPRKSCSTNTIDWASMSQSGDYLLILNRDSLGGSETAGVNVYNRSMVWQRKLTDYLGHGDIGYRTDGTECYVCQNNSTSALHSIRLSDGDDRVELAAAAISWYQHISCRNLGRKGYAFTSSFTWDTGADPDGGTDRYGLYDISAIRLDGTGAVERWAQPHLSTNYSESGTRSANACPNRDGTKVIFASDWEVATAGATVNAFVASRMRFPGIL
jgi:hypothetical protein